MIRFTTAAVVCAVAAFAAVVSYSPIYGLGRAHGQDGTAARQWPPARERGSMSMKPYDELALVRAIVSAEAVA